MDERLHKYFLGELNSEEQSELFHLLRENSALREQFRHHQNLYALLDILPNHNDITKGEKSYNDFISKSKKTKSKYLPHILKYAAAIAVLVISTWWITYSIYQNKFETETNTLYVPPGQRACLTLHDGTTVWLNAKSTLTYPSRFSEDKREVKLTGEAFFDVSKNPFAPFSVSVKDITVKVLGTEFNLLAYPESEQIQTSLLSGSVEITNKTTNRKITLIPDQEALITGTKMEIGNIKQHAYFLWKDGIYSFDQERFAEIIKKLELYYDTKIIVKNPEIYNFVYTGKFRQQDGIDEILRIIQKIHNFKIDRDRENNTITLSK
ncbi:FecR domain-containing protein [Massilibacteroides sp.]|uniref:FecR domain-containing protein n=1 Tax=Massilibacteroides sp. TaxID=2034766 RepID=UPI002633B1D4|nr:FecR domain-containing protein [Massilibacteroides sp.]MDD4514715.1 FecR domain-containing protein [Massilibacteroides sp.]